MPKLTARAAIAQVLKSGQPMKVPDIIKAAVPLTNLGGKTPGQTVYSVLYSDNKKTGTGRQFIQAGKGQFKLNPNFKPTVRASGAGSKKTAAKKTAAKKSTAKKTSARKSAAKKTTARRSSRRSSATA